MQNKPFDSSEFNDGEFSAKDVMREVAHEMLKSQNPHARAIGTAILAWLDSAIALQEAAQKVQEPHENAGAFLVSLAAMREALLTHAMDCGELIAALK